MNPKLVSSPYSHDLMNSLYTIKGMAEVHLETIPKDSVLDSDVLVRVKRKAEEALSIVRRLQTPRIQEEEKEQKENPSFHSRGRVSIHRAFEETRRLLTKQGLADGIEFLNRIPNHFPLIHCKRSQFREILYHLMKNASEAMKEKEEKRIILRASAANGGNAVIRLTDTGQGISPEHLARLFQPFFTTKPEGKGNGLGLYLVKKLVEENQGVISLESFPNEGTAVTLVFPLVQSV